jgi:hypothetical protein
MAGRYQPFAQRHTDEAGHMRLDFYPLDLFDGGYHIAGNKAHYVCQPIGSAKRRAGRQ